jgi:hypothetical protein
MLPMMPVGIGGPGLRAQRRRPTGRACVVNGTSIMFATKYAHRSVIATWGAIAAVAAIAGLTALEPSRVAIGDIQVDVAPLRANAGDPTATWVEEELPRRLAEALAGRLTPKGDRLEVRVDDLTLGPNPTAVIDGRKPPDNIAAHEVIGNLQRPVRATTSNSSPPAGQIASERSNHDRVSQLVQALASRIAGDR